MLKVDKVSIVTVSGLQKMVAGEWEDWQQEMEKSVFLLDADSMSQLALLLGRRPTRANLDDLLELWGQMEPLLMAAVADGRLHWLGTESALEDLNQALGAHGLPAIPWEVVDRICGAVHMDCLDRYFRAIQTIPA